jgi:protein-S-isoprenylcysteine O-methyltransferase Ste14
MDQRHTPSTLKLGELCLQSAEYLRSRFEHFAMAGSRSSSCIAHLGSRCVQGEAFVKLNIATLAVILAGAIVFVIQSRGMPWTPSRILGICIAAPSLLLLVIARLQLGGAFSVKAKASFLVTTGLYSRIRNPIYVFGGLTILGIIIFVGQPWWLLCLAVLIPLQFYRGRKESQVLEAKFGDAYREYKQKTWF